MNLIRLYYVTGTVFILLTIILAFFSMLSLEDMIVLALAGVLFLALGLVQHLLLIHEKLQKPKVCSTDMHPSY